MGLRKKGKRQRYSLCSCVHLIPAMYWPLSIPSLGSDWLEGPFQDPPCCLRTTLPAPRCSHCVSTRLCLRGRRCGNGQVTVLCVRVCVLSQLSCPALCHPVDCSPPGSSALGIRQARILEGAPTPCSRDLPDPGIEPASLVTPALRSLPRAPPGRGDGSGIRGPEGACSGSLAKCHGGKETALAVQQRFRGDGPRLRG